MLASRHTEERYRQALNASIFGALLTISINAAIILLCRFNGLKYIYPPPEEKTMIVDFEEMEAPEIKLKRYGREPSSEDAKPTETVEFVQKSEAQHEGTKENIVRKATVSKDGDVDVPEPPREEQIDNRSLFHAANNGEKDSLAVQTAKTVSDALKAGHASGNSDNAKLNGTPTARVKGRSTIGVPTRPVYSVQNEGTVVVEIWVDQMGSVTNAIPGTEGTTVTDKNLWNAARNAAMTTKFNPNPEAPGLQKGTITYIFKLK